MENENLSGNSFVYFLKNIYSYFLQTLKFFKLNLNFVFPLVLIFSSIELLSIILLQFTEHSSQFHTTFSILQNIFLFLLSVIFDIVFIKYLQRDGLFLFHKTKSDILKLLIPVAIVKILCTIYIAIGIILFIIPGIILSLRYMLIMYYAICYEENFHQAKENSAELMYGYKWYFLCFEIIFLILYALIYIIIYTQGSTAELDYSSVVSTIKQDHSSSLIFITIENILAYTIEITNVTVIYLFWKDRVKNSNTQEEY